MVERPALDERAEGTERPPERLSGRGPVAELRAEAVGRLGLVDEVVLVDAEETQQLEQRRNGRLGEPSGPGFGGVDDVDRALSRQAAREGNGGKPSRDTATHDCDPPDSSIRFHVLSGQSPEAAASLAAQAKTCQSMESKLSNF